VGPRGRVIGVDATPAMLELAARHVARAGLDNVELRQGLIEALPVEDHSVDLVISNCVISLSPEKERVFGEIARVLRPGGALAISDLVVDRRLAWLLGRLGRLAPTIAMARPEDEYLEAMRRSGLSAPRIVSRLVYEPADLLALFSEELSTGASASCPLAVVARTLVPGALGRLALRALARLASGRVWSARFVAGRISPP
jgi:arsenite methyltransferase